MLKNLVLILISFLLVACGEAFKPKKVDTRETPINAEERARKNINEGRGTSFGDLIGRGGRTTYQFSTSNPMWRASLEILDFLPLTTVDYSGGMIITDWYSENTSEDPIKITVRFLDNEIKTENLKIIIHKKSCSSDNKCKVNVLKNSKINEELLTAIIRKAAILEKNSSKKK